MITHNHRQLILQQTQALKAEWWRETARSYKPWIPEPGLWLQWDYGDGPRVAGDRAVLFCAWLAWSRLRLVLALRDKTLPSVIAALDATFRFLGGAPTYALTDNEKTVTERHIARVAVRNPKMVSAAVYYGVTIATCVPADPEHAGHRQTTPAALGSTQAVGLGAERTKRRGSWVGIDIRGVRWTQAGAWNLLP